MFNIYSILNKNSNTFIIITIIIIIIINLVVRIYLEIYNFQQNQLLLNENIKIIDLLLEQMQTNISNQVKMIAMFPELLDINDFYLYKRKLYIMLRDINISGISIWDNSLNLVFKTGQELNYGNCKKLYEDIYKVTQEGYTLSFLSENDNYKLQINGVTGIYNEYSIGIEGLLIITEVLDYEYLQLLENKLGGVIKLFKINELRTDDNNLLNKIETAKGNNYYIEKRVINFKSYMIGYLPVKDFYNRIIGYFTILKPEDSIIKGIYIVIDLCNLAIILLLYSVYKRIKLDILI